MLGGIFSMKKIVDNFLLVWLLASGAQVGAMSASKNVPSLQVLAAKKAAKLFMSEELLTKLLADPELFWITDSKKASAKFAIIPTKFQECIAENMHVFLHEIPHLPIQHATNVTLSADGQIMVAKHSDNTATIWHRTAAGFVQVQLIQNVWYETLSSDGQIMVVGDYNDTVTVWHKTAAGFVRINSPSIQDVLDVRLSSDGQVMVVNHINYTATVWQKTAAGFVQVQQPIQDVCGVTLSANDQVMVVNHFGGTATVWYKTAAGFEQVNQPPIQNVSNIKLSADGQVMVVRHCNNTATVWHRTDAGFVQVNQSPIQNVWNVTLSSDGQIMVVEHIGHNAMVWQKTDAGFVQVQLMQNVLRITLSSDGRTLFIINADKTVSIFKCATLPQSILVYALNMLQRNNKTLDFEQHPHLYEVLESCSPDIQAQLENQYNIKPLTKEQKNELLEWRKKLDETTKDLKASVANKKNKKEVEHTQKHTLQVDAAERRRTGL